MSYFDDASLVMIPSGYKTSKVYSVKPTDGTGDLAFTRSNDTATRVASNGLIERVRTNLVLQSNTFSTSWSTSNATITGGQAGYDGTNNAWELAASLSGGNILQNNTQSGLQTFSAYVKGDVSTGVRIYAFGSVNANAYFNLNLGTVGAISGATAKIEAVGGGWYRCSISFDQTNVTVRLYTSNNANAQAAGTIYIQNAQLQTGDIATDYIATTTAAVSVGPVANVPRLDYLNSSCGRLLLEPQRTNLLTFSEQMDNAAFTKFGSSVSANQTVSPDGFTNSDKLLPNNGIGLTVPSGGIFTSGAAAYVRSGALTLTAASYTFSIFVKKAELDYVQLRSGTSVDLTTNGSGNLVNLNNGTPAVANTVQDYGNGWYRVSHTFTATAATWYVGIWFWNTTSLTANGSQGIFAYGAALELGSYATSYIPTLGAAVTRGADACRKTGISSLIGQTEGTLFADFEFNGKYDVSGNIPILVHTGTSEAYIFVNTSGILLLEILNAGVLSASISVSIGAVGRKKIAFAYKANDFVGYMNGVQIGTDTSGSVGAMADFNVGSYRTTGYSTTGGVNQALLFKTRLTNAQLAELTTI